jgi:hypothetical protein
MRTLAFVVEHDTVTELAVSHALAKPDTHFRVGSLLQ